MVFILYGKNLVTYSNNNSAQRGRKAGNDPTSTGCLSGSHTESASFKVLPLIKL